MKSSASGKRRWPQSRTPARNPASRNLVVRAILDELLSMPLEYERCRFAAFRDAWTVSSMACTADPRRSWWGRTRYRGIARGVDADGALLLEIEGRMQRPVSREASLRLISRVTLDVLLKTVVVCLVLAKRVLLPVGARHCQRPRSPSSRPRPRRH